MAITARASGTGSGSGTGTTITITKPSGVKNGDVVWAVASIKNNTDLPTAASGWDQVGGYAGNAEITVALFVRVAGASEPSSYIFSFSTNTAADPNSACVYTEVGVDTTTPQDLTAPTTTNSLTLAVTTYPTETTATDSAEVILGEGDNGSANYSTPPSGYTKRVSVLAVSRANIYTKLLTPAGSIGTVTGTKTAGVPWGALASAAQPIVVGVMQSPHRYVRR